MKITLSERFQADVRPLTPLQREQLFSVLLALPGAMRDAARHTGLGLRKIHPSGIWEARIGLGLRLLFALDRDTAILVRIADHDEVRRFLKSL